LHRIDEREVQRIDFNPRFFRNVLKIYVKSKINMMFT
jgi:hypothetical protein